MSTVFSSSIKKVSGEQVFATDDLLAVEEPLEIRLDFQSGDGRTTKNLSITMRTPDNDTELAAGFLFTEGIITQRSDIASMQSLANTVVVKLRDGHEFDMQQLERHFYTSSSCGVCGKSSIDSIRTLKHDLPPADIINVDQQVIYTLPALLRKQQEVFDSTGGLHASALFDLEGNFIMLREDVGRHNALDKLIGAALEKEMLPLATSILLLSGRASFELVQKAAMAGIRLIAAVGAPSSLAVQLAKEFDITLIGFLRNERFNIYCGEDRISFGHSDHVWLR